MNLPNKCDAAVEPSSQTNVGERLLHGRKIVRDDEGGEEQPAVGGCHTIGSQVCWIRLGRNDPC